MNAIDTHIAQFDDTTRAELERIRAIAHEMLPGYEEKMSYAMPTVFYKNVPIIAFDGHKHHVGIYPYSSIVIPEIPELSSYSTTKGAIQEKLDSLLPKELIEKIITTRLQQKQLTV